MPETGLPAPTLADPIQPAPKRRGTLPEAPAQDPPGPAPALPLQARPVPAAVPPQADSDAEPGGKGLKPLTLEFGFSSSTVNPRYTKQLAGIAALVNASPGAVVLIEGHTDDVGRWKPNMALSQHRAQNVKRLLVDYGVSADKISIKGYGYSRPKATNTTSQGRSINRRAVLTITVIILQ